jgi:hypothetical protein
LEVTSRNFKLSIREIKKVINYCEFLFEDQNYANYAVYLGVFLCVIKTANSRVYQAVKNKEIDLQELIKIDGFKSIIREKTPFNHLFYILEFSLCRSEQESQSKMSTGKAAEILGANTENFRQFCESNTNLIEDGHSLIQSFCKRLDFLGLN